ncbi:hypothetical protein K503DRAFT_105243 [Rhizopogon vinicolor AM-OR11-026]|uniref:Uncharacterized protein n=1 Tax=Rhizopogon vinicolor AM-OR11-026 TaxID=1314800 RepID=A0A1B7MF56_9AGAM|nr:hypothetical protein K503DRAFT_105243 [Rhizopogon vinicolor AM-OR11-026]
MRQDLVGAVLLHRQWETMSTPCLKFKVHSSPLTDQKNDTHLLAPPYRSGLDVRTGVPLGAHLFGLVMPQQSRGRGFWGHAPSRLQIYYVDERQSQVDLIYIPPTACMRTTGRVECVRVVPVSVHFKICDAHCRIHTGLCTSSSSLSVQFSSTHQCRSGIEQYLMFTTSLKD